MRLVLRLMRWTGMAGAFLLCLIGILLGFLRWGTQNYESGPPGEVIGWNLSFMEWRLEEAGAGILPLLFIYVNWAMAVVPPLLAVTVGVRARWGRFVAAVPAVLAVAYLIFYGYYRLADVAEPSSILYDPGQAARMRLVAGLVLAAAVLTALAVVALIARWHTSYDAFVVGLIAAAGVCELAGVGLLAATGVFDPHLVAWLAGPVHLLAAALAAMSALGARLSLRAGQPPPARPWPPAHPLHPPGPVRPATTGTPW